VGGNHCRYLQVLAVDPIIWNRGIGRKLVQWGLDEVDRDSLGPADVFLEAGLRAEAFYNRLGFETLRWDSLDFKDAPDGQVKWPLMLRRGSKGSTS
jgi:predicted N-acetyltransferase YhbS